MAFPFVLFHRDLFLISAAFSVSDSLLRICSNSSSCHNVFKLLFLRGVTNLQDSSLGFVQLAWWHADVSRRGGGQPCQLLSFHLRRHSCCASTSPPANFQGSHRIVLAHFCILCSLRLIAVWFLEAIWLPEWSQQLSSFLAFYVSKGRTGRSNTSLRTLGSFCRNMKSAVHVLYAGWLILSCSALVRADDFKNFLSSMQVLCGKIFNMLWYDASSRCLCVQSSISSPLHHLPSRRLSVLICLQAPVSLSSCLAPHSPLPLFVLHPSRYYQMSNGGLDKLLSLSRGTAFFTWRLTCSVLLDRDTWVSPWHPSWRHLRFQMSSLQQRMFP